MKNVMTPLIVLIVILLAFVGFTQSWFDGIFGGTSTTVLQGFIETDPGWDNKGEIAVGESNNNANFLPVGTDGQFLSASSTATVGVAWVTPTLETVSPFTSAQLRNSLSDESGTGAAIFNNATALELDQLTGDGEILSLRSTGDVAHGITAVTLTNSYATFSKSSATEGGLELKGFSEGNNGLRFWGYATSDNTSKDATANGYVEILAAKKSGVGATVPGVDANLFVIREGGGSFGAKFIIDQEGDIFADGSDVTVYDHADDIALLRDLRICQTDGKSISLNSRYGTTPLTYSCNSLESMGFLTLNKTPTISPITGEIVDSPVFWNLSQAGRLTMDAVRQLAEDTDTKLAELEARISALETK